MFCPSAAGNNTAILNGTIRAVKDVHEDVEMVLCADAEWPKLHGRHRKIEVALAGIIQG